MIIRYLDSQGILDRKSPAGAKFRAMGFGFRVQG